MTTMTLSAAHKTDAAYWGDRGDWIIAYEIHRDSDVLERSNFRSMERMLEAADAAVRGEDDEPAVAIERSSHWAVGWIDRLVVRPGTAAAEEAERLKEKIASYPVLDEEDYGSLELEEAAKVWENSSLKDRIYYPHRYSKGVSIFAARRGELPDDESGELVMALAN